MNATIGEPLDSRRLFVRNLKTFFTHPQSRSIGLVFASMSTLFGSWVTHIPYVKDKLGLDEAQLGLILFALPVGLISMNPLISPIINRLGAPQATLVSVLSYCFLVMIPILAPTIPTLILGLFLMGLNGSLLNVSMNTTATAMEQFKGIKILSSCHAMWSLGGLFGAGVSSLMIGFGISPQLQLLTMALFIFGLNVFHRLVLLSIPFVRSEQAGVRFTLPNLALLGMIFVGIAFSFGEGVAFDWSAVYLRETLGATAGVAALAFAGFSLMMMLGRFTGDTLIPRFGEHAILIYSSLFSALGLGIAIFLPTPVTAILGFALLGAGCALGAPILYNASSRVPGLPPGAGLATFVTFSYVGFLAGPPVIGLIAREIGLGAGLGVVAVILLIAAVVSRKVEL